MRAHSLLRPAHESGRDGVEGGEKRSEVRGQTIEGLTLVLRYFRWVTDGVCSLLAERGIEGSRGLQRTLASILYRLLLARMPHGYTVWKEEPLTFLDSEPEPDISVTRGGERDFTEAHPSTAELVVDVAVSNPALDRENASPYAEARVKEYWIVLGHERCVEVHRCPENGHDRERIVLDVDGVLECSSVPGVRVGA